MPRKSDVKETKVKTKTSSKSTSGGPKLKTGTKGKKADPKKANDA